MFGARTSKPVENLRYFDRVTVSLPQTKRLRACKIGLQSPFGHVRSPFGRRAVRRRGYGLRSSIFISRSSFTVGL